MKDQRRVARQVLEACGVPVREDADLQPTANQLKARGRLQRRLLVLGAAVLLVTGPASIAGELPGPAWLGLAGTVVGGLAALVAPHLLPDRNVVGDLAASLLERTPSSESSAETAARARSPGGQLLESQRQALQLTEDAVGRLAESPDVVGEVTLEVRRKWRRFELFRAAVVAGLAGVLVRDVWAGTDATWAVVTAVAILLAMWLGLERVRERAAATLARWMDSATPPRPGS